MTPELERAREERDTYRAHMERLAAAVQSVKHVLDRITTRPPNRQTGRTYHGWDVRWAEHHLPDQSESCIFCAASNLAAEALASIPEQSAWLWTAMEEALQEIAKGKGAFSRDPLIHASNTIDHMKKVAVDALATVRATWETP